MKKSGGGSNIGDKGRILPADPNLPRFLCQNCRQSLCRSPSILMPTNSSPQGPMMGNPVMMIYTGMQGPSVLGWTRMDNSFLVLPNQRNQTPPGAPNRPNHSGKTIDESFIVLPSQLLRCINVNPDVEPMCLHMRPFVSSACGFCLRNLKKEVEDASQDIKAYETCLQHLEGEAKTVLIEAEFLKEKLKEFADFANLKDKENNIPPEKCFKLPHKIENDKVDSYSITQSFNKPENWTKALKYTLCDLKWALYWFVGNTSFLLPPSPLILKSQEQAQALVRAHFTVKEVTDTEDKIRL